MTTVDYERSDSLEGWVAIKSNIFEEMETFKLHFIVQWNVIEGKFAVTCHNRTLQRQKRKEESALDDTQTSWAGLFSVDDLKNIHRHFTGVSDILLSYFPNLTDFEAGNIWDVIFLNRSSSETDETERDLDTPCRQLEKYFCTAVDVCGRKIVLDSLFMQDERDVEEYFENLLEFKRKTMHDQVVRARDNLRRILQQHKTTEKLVLLLTMYEEEDEAYKELVTMATLFYQYLLQPFRDMRELAMLYKMEILKSLEFEELGPRRIAALEKEAEEWRKRAEDAVSSIQDITVNYFLETSKALTGMLRQMEEDKQRFGKASWATAAPRLEKLKFMLAKETLQLMRAKEMCLNRNKEDIRDRMRSLADQGEGPETVDLLELQYYEAQLELYDVKFEILKNEELLLMAQIDTVRRLIKELKEEVVYYDTCEDPDELQSMMDLAGSQQDAGSPTLRKLKRRLQQLESKRGAICARRAYLRNKKDQCVDLHEEKHRQAEQSAAQFTQHHAVQLKREQKKQEEEKRKEWMNQERERTLSRLRSFREKKQGHYVLKTPRTKAAVRGPPASIPSQPLSISGLSPSSDTTVTTPKKKRQKPKDVPVKIFVAPGPCTTPLDQAFQTPPPPCPPPPPPPPPLPPPPPPPAPLVQNEGLDIPMPLLSEQEQTPFPAKNTLKQNIGSMDEVLASLQRGEMQLRKVEPPPAQAAGTTPEDLRDNILSAIRRGVKLRKVQPRAADRPLHEDSDLERSIKAAMQRMKRVSSDSDDEDRGDSQTGEWDG